VIQIAGWLLVVWNVTEQRVTNAKSDGAFNRSMQKYGLIEAFYDEITTSTDKTDPEGAFNRSM
jgi:hypothetical protein